MRQIVNSPALRRHNHSLYDVANVVEPGDDRWIDGVTFTPSGCQVIFGHDAGCWSPRGDKHAQDCPAVAVFTPYVLEATLAWSTGDMNADPKGMIQEAFEVGTSAVLERLIEKPIVNAAGAITIPALAGARSTVGITGRTVAGTLNPHLADGLAVIATPTVVDGAIGLVEAKLLDASDHVGGAGVIYMSPIAAALSTSALHRAEDDGALTTVATGCRVVVGNFGDSFVYGHIGEVDLYLDSVQFHETVRHGANEYVAQAERSVTAVWNTCGLFRQEYDLPT